VNTVGTLTLDGGTLDYADMCNTPYGFLKVCRRFAGLFPKDTLMTLK
jgi:hypothetical protein